MAKVPLMGVKTQLLFQGSNTTWISWQKSADSKGCKCMKSWRKCRGVTAFYRLNTTWKSCRSADSNLLFMGVEKHCFFMGSKCKWKYFDKNHKSFLIV